MPSDPARLQAAVGPACNRIRDAIRSRREAIGVTRLGQALEKQQQTVHDQGRQLEKQQSLLNQLVTYSMSASIFDHLCGIAILKEYKYHHGLAFQREMYFLRDNGFIKPKSESFVDFDANIDGIT